MLSRPITLSIYNIWGEIPTKKINKIPNLVIKSK